jgi:hypothetical protein
MADKSTTPPFSGDYLSCGANGIVSINPYVNNQLAAQAATRLSCSHLDYEQRKGSAPVMPGRSEKQGIGDKRVIPNTPVGTASKALHTTIHEGVRASCQVTADIIAIRTALVPIPGNPLVVDVLLDGGGEFDTPLYRQALAIEEQDEQGEYVAVTL